MSVCFIVVILSDGYYGSFRALLKNKTQEKSIKEILFKNIDSNEETSLVENTNSIDVVCWLLNVPTTCECISGTDLLRQFYVLPH